MQKYLVILFSFLSVSLYGQNKIPFATRTGSGAALYNWYGYSNVGIWFDSGLIAPRYKTTGTDTAFIAFTTTGIGIKYTKSMFASALYSFQNPLQLSGNTVSILKASYSSLTTFTVGTVDTTLQTWRGNKRIWTSTSAAGDPQLELFDAAGNAGRFGHLRLRGAGGTVFSPGVNAALNTVGKLSFMSSSTENANIYVLATSGSTTASRMVFGLTPSGSSTINNNALTLESNGSGECIIGFGQNSTQNNIRGGSGSNIFTFTVGNTSIFTITNAQAVVSGKTGLNQNTPTAYAHLGAGTATANTAPLKFTSGTNLTVAENGAVEYDGTNWYATSGGTRYFLSRTLTATASLDFGSTASGTSTDLTITLTGAASGDVVFLGVPNGSTVANGCFTAWASASNTITVRFTNNSSTTSYDPASGTFRVSVLKY